MSGIASRAAELDDENSRMMSPQMGQKRKLKLNLGCGHDHRNGYVNVDVDPMVNPDLVWDLNKLPYPFDSGTCEHIILMHVYEHLTVHSIDLLKELYRLLEPNGVAELAFPNMFRLGTRIRYLTGNITEGLEWHPYHTKLIHWRYLVNLARHIGFDVKLIYGPRVRRLPPIDTLRMLFASVVGLRLRKRP